MNLRNTLTLLLLATIGLSSCTEQKNAYTITGTVSGIDTATVYLKKREAGKWITVDSTALTDHAFSFTGTLLSPEMVYLTMPEKDYMLPFFLENSPIAISISVDTIVVSKVTGSATHEVYKLFMTASEEINKEMNGIYKAYKDARDAGDEAGMAQADSLYEAAEMRKKEMILSFATEQHTSVVAPFLIMRNAYMFELPDLETVIVSLDTSLAGTPYYDNLVERVTILRTVQVGQPAPEFSQADSSGNPFSLSSLRGKVVLVDFWASWCGPCRAENPNVVAAWKEFSPKGFEVLGVSLDEDRGKWLQAVKDDNLAWPQVSDLQGWGNAVSNLYGVNSIPANVLVDQNGMIIARDLRGEALIEKLTEVLVSDRQAE